MPVSYLLGKPVRWASWLCKRFDSSADWDPTGQNGESVSETSRHDLSWCLPLNSPHKHNELAKELLCLGITEVQPLDSKYLPIPKQTASPSCFEKQVSSFWWHHYISTKTLLWWGEKGSRELKVQKRCTSLLSNILFDHHFQFMLE